MKIALGVVAGLLIGVVFFGGLRLTVRTMTRAKRPALVMLASVVVRMAVVVAGFYLMRPLGALAMLAGLGAVMSVRILMVRRERRVLGDAEEGGESLEHRSE